MENRAIQSCEPLEGVGGPSTPSQCAIEPAPPIATMGKVKTMVDNVNVTDLISAVEKTRSVI